MSTPIIPMAMKPRMNTPFKLYYLAFPPEWKAQILRMHLTVDPKFNTLYNLKTNVLYGYLNGWLDNIVQLHTMKQESDDKDWLVSMYEPDIEKICDILKIWIIAEYVENKRKTTETESIADELLTMINADTLRTGLRSENSILFDEDGHALTDYAFDAFSLYAANTLQGKTISVQGHELTFSGCGRKMLLSQPISDGKSNPNYYAISLQLSVQTTPPFRSCMLLIHGSVKRIISNNWKKEIYLNNDIHAYVSMGQFQYRSITLNRYPHVWSSAEQKCYNLYCTKALPDAETVLTHPESYLQSDPLILLPYKNGMDFTNMRIGTGLSVLDKSKLFNEISDLMQEFAVPVDQAEPLGRGKVTHQNKLPEPALCRERLKASSGLDALIIEIYGHETDNELKKLITNELEKHLGTETDPSLFPIRIFNKELGALGDMMHDSSYEEHCARIKEVSRSIPKSDTITGAIIILENNAEQEGDPKHALRAGFADINRVTQFITPIKDNEKDTENRVHGTVMDLLRQFGYTEFTENKLMKKNPAFDTDTIGMTVLHQLRPLWTKSERDTARFLPVYVTCRIRSGQIYVDCDLLKKRHMSYPEALLAFSKLSREQDFVKKCIDASRSGFRSKLIGLQSLYRDNPALLLVRSDGVTRPLWHGLTDKMIAEYPLSSPFVPEQIEIGTKKFSDKRSFLDSEIRIIRIRDAQSSHEVPDYFTPQNDKGKCISASGIYRYEDVFWGLESRPNNKEYWNSYQNSRFQSPAQNYDECSLVEFYPLQLQIEDHAEDWVSYANYLREVMPETSRSIRLPAPLHLGGLMKEYLLLAQSK